MRPAARTLFAVVALLLIAGAAMAQQEKTQQFTLDLTTRVQALGFDIPVVPGMPNIPGMHGEPTRSITGLAMYPTKAVAPMFVSVPGDLNLPGNQLVLSVPKPVRMPGGADTPGVPRTPAMGAMTFQVYWHPDEAQGPITASFGGGPAVAPGGAAPKLDTGQLDAALARQATGQANKLPEAVVGRGQYILNTGGMAVLDGFLPPLSVMPKSLADVDPANGIALQWQPVTGALGYILHAMGTTMAGQQMTMTQWVSTMNEPPVRVRWGYEQATTIADDIRDGILLPPTATSCRVPPKIFAGVTTLNVTVTAVGKDFYSDDNGVTVRGRIRSEWFAMKMGQMPGMPGAGGNQE